MTLSENDNRLLHTATKLTYKQNIIYKYIVLNAKMTAGLILAMQNISSVIIPKWLSLHGGQAC